MALERIPEVLVRVCDPGVAPEDDEARYRDEHECHHLHDAYAVRQPEGDPRVESDNCGMVSQRL